VFPHVDYRSGRMHDMNCVTCWVHAAGAMMLWDVAHSAGAAPVDLGQAVPKFAVVCGYKQRDEVI
jgi:kynureninase